MARQRIRTPKLAQARRTPVAREAIAQVNDTFFRSQTQNQVMKQAGTQELVSAITTFGTAAGKMEKKTNDRIDSQSLVHANLIKSRAETSYTALLQANPDKTSAELAELDEYKAITDSFASVQGKLKNSFISDFQATAFKGFTMRDSAITYNNSVNLASEVVAQQALVWGQDGVDSDTIGKRLESFKQMFKSEDWKLSDEDINAIFLAENSRQVTAGGHSTAIADYLLRDGSNISPQMRLQIEKLKGEAGKKSVLEKEKLANKVNIHLNELIDKQELTQEHITELVDTEQLSAAAGQAALRRQEREKDADAVEAAKRAKIATDNEAILSGDLTHLSAEGKAAAYGSLEQGLLDALESDPDHPLNQGREKVTVDGVEKYAPLDRKVVDEYVFPHLSRIGLAHKGTRLALEAGSKTLNKLTDKGQANPLFKKAFERYQVAKTSNYIRTLDLSDDDLANFESVEILMKVGGQSFDDAVIQASEALNNPNASDNLNAKYRIDSKDLLVNALKEIDIEKAGYVMTAFGASNTKNASYSNMLSELNRYQDLLIKAGTTPEEAQKKAIERAADYENYGGVLYHNRGMPLAQHGAKIVARSEMVISQFLEDNPRFSHTSGDKITSDDFVMKPSTNQSFVLVDKVTQLPATDRFNRIVRISYTNFLESGGALDKQMKEKTRNTIKESKKESVHNK